MFLKVKRELVPHLGNCFMLIFFLFFLSLFGSDNAQISRFIEEFSVRGRNFASWRKDLTVNIFYYGILTKPTLMRSAVPMRLDYVFSCGFRVMAEYDSKSLVYWSSKSPILFGFGWTCLWTSLMFKSFCCFLNHVPFFSFLATDPHIYELD